MIDINADIYLALKMSDLISYCTILLKGVSYVEFDFQGVFDVHRVPFMYN